MKTLVFISLSVFAFMAIASVNSMMWQESNTHLYTHEHYEVQFGKKYSNLEEHQMRKQIFEENLKIINSINADPSMTWKAGVNHLTDRTTEELDSLKGYNREAAKQFFSSLPVVEEPMNFLNDLPESIDWREKGVVNEAKDQASCGSCWAFSSVAALESHLAISSGKLLDLSEQQQVSCAPNPDQCGGKGGCAGSTQWLGFQYVQSAGLATSKSYPYQARDTTCDEGKNDHVASVQGYVRLPTNDADALMNAVANIGPVSISVAATNWQFYSSGVYNGKCGAEINHAVTAVGYGTDAKLGPYWIVRNSWSRGWGEKGYIRIAREKTKSDIQCEIDKHPENGSGCKGGPKEITVCGKCGMYSDSSYPVGVKLN